MNNLNDIKQSLDAPLLTTEVKVKPGSKGARYISGETALRAANRVFGFENWSYEITDQKIFPNESDLLKPIFISRVKLTVNIPNHGTVVHEDVGTGIGSTSYVGPNIDVAAKGSVTDAIKRCLRAFGDQFGLVLYDPQSDNLIDPDTAKTKLLEFLLELAGDKAATKTIWSKLLEIYDQKELIEMYLYAPQELKSIVSSFNN